MKRHCPFCKEEIEETSIYCSNCGRRVDTYFSFKPITHSTLEKKKRNDVSPLFFVIIVLNLTILSLFYFLPLFEQGSLLSIFIDLIKVYGKGLEEGYKPFFLFYFVIQSILFISYIVLVILGIGNLIKRNVNGFFPSFFLSFISYSLFMMLFPLLFNTLGEYKVNSLIFLPIVMFVFLIVLFVLFIANTIKRRKAK